MSSSKTKHVNYSIIRKMLVGVSGVSGSKGGNIRVLLAFSLDRLDGERQMCCPIIHIPRRYFQMQLLLER
jgi:hypothetical protein